MRPPHQQNMIIQTSLLCRVYWVAQSARLSLLYKINLTYLAICVIHRHWIWVVMCRTLSPNKVKAANICFFRDVGHGEIFACTSLQPEPTFDRRASDFRERNEIHSVHIFTVGISRVAVANPIATVFVHHYGSTR